MTALNRHNPLHWLGLLLLAWLVLGVQLAAPKVASGPFYAATEHHLGVTRWEAAPRLGLDAWTADFASGDTVGAKGTGAVIDTAPMAQKISDIRATLPSKLKGDGNMAVADVNIDGLPSQMAAHSRINNPTAAQQAQGIVGEGAGIFQTQSVPNKSGVLIPRAGDSEAKILDSLAQKLGDNTAAKGSVTIFTERAACSSCLGVVEQFKTKYPNIQVNVLDNNGVVMRPPKGN